MKSSTYWLAVGSFVLLTNASSLAQSQQSAVGPPDGGTREAVTDIGTNQVLISILIPSLPNAPFTAIVNTEWIRTANGGRIKLTNHRAIARDSAGRIFQERRGLVPDDGKTVSPLTQIEISDPVSHDLFICVLQQLTCQVEVLSLPEGSHWSMDSVLKAPGMEDLGTRFISGLEAIGRRQVTKIAIGAIGNDQPLAAEREFWYSPRLGINLISKRSDPRFGNQNFSVSNIVLGEPDPKLFQLPPGLKIIDLRNAPEIPSGEGSTPH